MTGHAGLRTAVSALLATALCVLAPALTGCGAAPAAEGPAQASGEPAASSGSPGPDDPVASRMKTIGVIGGISWVSSEQYYREMNQLVRDRFGPDYSAPILMYSIPFGEFAKQERLADKGDWGPLDATMIDAAQRLERGGADFIVIASNTMNSTAGIIEQQVTIPVLRIQDPVGKAVKQAGISKVALLGTRYTMEEGFYRDRLHDKYGLDVVTPNAAERTYVNDVIFNQLCAGEFTATARARFVRIIARLVEEEGAQGVILGCTEIPLLVKQKDVDVPVFDSTALHVRAAVGYALGED